MFNNKIKKENAQLKNRIKELEEIICPCQQHDFVEIDNNYVVVCTAPLIDGYTEHTLMCKKCKKIIIR